MIEAVAAAADVPAADRAPRGDGRRRNRARRANRAHATARRTRPLRDRALSAARADARAAGGRHRGCDGAHSDGGARVEARRRARPGPQGRRRRAHLHAHRQRRHRRRARDRRRVSALPARDADSRRRSHRAQAPTAHPIRFRTRCAASDACCDIEAMRATMPLSVFFFDCLRRDDQDLVAMPGAARFEAMTAALPSELVIAAPGDQRARRRAGLLRRRARARSRGRDGQGARRAVRARRAQRVVAQGQAQPHARPRRPRRGMGTRPPQGLAVESAPRRDRSGDRRVRHARQDLQGHDRRDAGVADRGAPEAARSRATTGPYSVRPELVVEVTFNDLQASPRYPGGLALRFARVKGYRPDKKAQDADTMDTVRAIYAATGKVDSRKAIAWSIHAE